MGSFSFVKPTSIDGVSLVGVSGKHGQVVQRFHYQTPISIEEECFIAARYSRSDKPVEDIITEIYDQSIDMADRAKKIVIDYGHSSVAEFANVNISFEGVSELLALFILNKVNVYAASQRSTRYQKMGTDNFVIDLPDVYSRVYQEACKEGKNYGKDAYDSIRYLLPLATRTNLWVCTNLREWARIISLLTGYDKYPEFVETGNLIKYLLTEKIGKVNPPGSYLVRHCEPYNYERERLIWEDLKDSGLSKPDKWDAITSLFTNHDIIPDWLNLYFSKLTLLRLDLGQIRDWNRHRSLIRIIPLIEYVMDSNLTKLELITCPENDKVDEDFNLKVFGYLVELQSHVDLMNPYTYPLSTQTFMYLGGPINKVLYILLLREKKGGHTSYRNTAKSLLNDWVKEID